MSRLKSDKPVWVNRDDTKAYMVTVSRPGGHIRPIVVTPNGPVMAKEIAEHAMACTAVQSELFVYPIVAPHIREVEHVLASASRVAQQSQLRLYHVEFQQLGRSTPSNLLVWTTRTRKEAGRFAEDTLPDSTIIQLRTLTNPIIVDQAEEALQTA